MKNQSILLSISMLISGKEDMEKSLKSLQYFKEAFPCEIILVDTGCNAGQRALAEQYADKVLDFVWCNDFAAARNVGLEAATGEWFMYLDDDEWFENPGEIIDFFLSGEYKEYYSASYVVRNYTNAQGTIYDDSYPSRMVKLEPETKFVGKIHEYLEPFKLPKKNFSDFVHHYGYVYKNEEEKKKHGQRNIQPLLEMRKEHPGDPRWMAQLAQEYFAVKDYEETIKVCAAGLEEWHALMEYVKFAPAHVGAVYAYILISLETMGRFEEEEVWLQKAFDCPMMKLEVMEPTVAFYCLVAARLYSNLNQYDLCREYYKRYMEYAKRLQNDRELLEAGTAAVVTGVFQEYLRNGLILMSMESLIRTEDYTLAKDAFFRLDWNDRRLLHQERWEKAMVNAVCHVNYDPLWVNILQTLVSRPDGMKEMLVAFLEAEISFKKQDEKAKLERLYRLVAQLTYGHPYIVGTKILWADISGELDTVEGKQKALTLFGEFFTKYSEELFAVKSEIWNVAQKHDISMEILLLQVDYAEWRGLVNAWSLEAELSDLQKWDARMAAWKGQEDIRYDFFAAKCMEGYLRVYQEKGLVLEEFEKLLWQYADSVLALYRPYYKEFVFEKMQMILPGEARLALKLQELCVYRQQGEEQKALACVRESLTLHPGMTKTMEAYAKLYRDEMHKRNQEAGEAQTELQHLVDTLKNAARQQIERNEYQAAKEILLQIQQCVPGDADVEELLEMVQVEQ